MIAAAVTPCPNCGEPSSENYGGAGLCWSCFERRAESKQGDKPRLSAVHPTAATTAPRSYEVSFTDTKPPKLILPVVPSHDDMAGLLAWLTSVLRLNPSHGATGVVHQGRRGPDGHVEIRRAGLPALRFEPAAAVNTARKFKAMLGWQLHPTDAEPYGFKDEHCGRIAHVLRLAAGACNAPDAAQEAAGIVGTFLSQAEIVEGLTTYGTSAQRHEAADAMRSIAMSPPRYLIDENTGEIVIRVSDLQEAARRHVGSSLPHGWIDARMQQLGWARAQLQGYPQPGRDGRKGGGHIRCDVYRGHLPTDPADEGQVNT